MVLSRRPTSSKRWLVGIVTLRRRGPKLACQLTIVPRSSGFVYNIIHRGDSGYLGSRSGVSTTRPKAPTSLSFPSRAPAACARHSPRSFAASVSSSTLCYFHLDASIISPFIIAFTRRQLLDQDQSIPDYRPSILLSVAF